MTTVIDLVGDALRDIGSASLAETIGAHKLAHGLRKLNQMLGGWSQQPNAIYYVAEDTHTLTASDGEYSIGTGGDINTTRPMHIVNAFIRDSSTDYEVEIVDRKQYDATGYKTTTGIPRFLYYEPTMSTGTIKLYPEPDSAYVLHIKSLKPFSSAYTQTDSFALPPGYEEAIQYNLAIRLAPSYGRQIPPDLLMLARNTLRHIKNQNANYRSSITRSNPFFNNYGSDITGDVVL